MLRELGAAWSPVSYPNWGEADPCGRNSYGASLWGGVNCDATNAVVTGISVTNVALGTSLPDPLWQLTSLVHLTLRGTSLSGPLLPGVGLLTLLADLDLSANALNETLPTELGSLVSLSLLSLAANHFVGSLPSEVGALANLARLSVASNRLGGVLPAQLGNLTKLVSLDASANAFNGSLPTSLGDLSSLASLLIPFNSLSGGIPAGLVALSELVIHGNAWLCGFSPSATVDIGGVNSTDTTFGTACGDVDALRALDLAWKTPASSWGAPDPCGRNSGARWGGLTCLSDFSRVSGLELRNVSLAGAIPAAAWNLTALVRLALANASLTGELSSSGLGALTNLSSLALGWNALDGVLPASLFGLTSLTSLGLPSNALSGLLPPGVGLLTLLSDLDLSETAVSGTLPMELFQLTVLTNLDLSASAMSGPLPSGVGNLRALRMADLSGCRFNESLPAALADLPSLVRFNAHNNSFTGVLPNVTFTVLESLDLSDNLLAGPLPQLFSGEFGAPSLNIANNAWLCDPVPPLPSGTTRVFTGACRVKPGIPMGDNTRSRLP